METQIPLNGKQAKKVGAWQRFKNRIYESELYRIFFVRALKNKRSKIIYIGSILLLIIAISGGYRFNPVYKLKEMNTLEGTYLKWTKPKHGSRIFIQAKDGEIVQFYSPSLSLREEKRLNMLSGEKVRCFFTNEYDVFTSWGQKRLFEIDYKGEKILNYDYDVYYSRIIIGRRVTIVTFFIALSLLAVVYYQNKNEI